jgi:histidine triad (HIT) family protein
MTAPSIFTRIINREIPANILFEDDFCIVIRDIQPKAPTHLLIIPKEPIPRLVDADESHHELLGHLLLKAGEMARELGVDEAFRIIINNGEEAGQSVFHLHLHLLADKSFSETNLGF